MPSFFIISTPIGNLKDITLRALEVLKKVDYILAENPQITLKLLSHYQIKKPLIKYHQHTKNIKKILKLLEQGKNLALVSSAGTPGISDPGNELLDEIYQKLPQIKIVPVPGASALSCAISICGFFMGKFLFLGFLPKKKKRKKIIEMIKNTKIPVIFFESPHRLLKTLEDLKKEMPERRIFLAKELTKKFEKTFRGKIKDIYEILKKEKIKGEWVLILDKDEREEI